MKDLFYTPSPTMYNQLTNWGNDLHFFAEIHTLPEIVMLTSYPPRECGIANYSQDLLKVMRSKFDQSFNFSICALEWGSHTHTYAEPVKYVLDTTDNNAYIKLAQAIENDAAIKMIVLQHEFGFFQGHEAALIHFLQLLHKPVTLVFHTVLPAPSAHLLQHVQAITATATSVVVMTKASKKILLSEYKIPLKKITVIPHGTHLVAHENKTALKEKHQLEGRMVLSTFGLLGSGKNIETTLKALPAIIKKNPTVLFLIIGKTHPAIVKQEGEQYRELLQQMIITLQLEEHVQLINSFVPLPLLLEYLQLTDIYLFTSKDPNQAVSGTFSYAISCGCPVVSTAIPHAKEVLKDDAGIIIDFEQPEQLATAVNSLLANHQLRANISNNALHRMASTAWENAAIAHALLFKKQMDDTLPLRYSLPPVSLQHLKKLTTDFGMIQFAKLNQPDLGSGYTIDDNARALVVMCQHYELTRDNADIPYINTYLRFISVCQQADGSFLNYLSKDLVFTKQNEQENLDDANGRAIWALGYAVSMQPLLPIRFTTLANSIIEKAMPHLHNIHSTRAMSFIIKGLHYRHLKIKLQKKSTLMTEMANRLLQMYRHEQEKGWYWYESYLTYANSVLPEAMLCAWITTGNPVYKETAVTSFDFLLEKLLGNKHFKVISNQTWLQKGTAILSQANGGEQPIDVAYTVLALNRFYQVFKRKAYNDKLDIAFNWFLGANHLNQIIYNPRTGGCYDGIEEQAVNLNQGAESTVSYLMARLTMEKMLRNKNRLTEQKKHFAVTALVQL